MYRDEAQQARNEEENKKMLLRVLGYQTHFFGYVTHKETEKFIKDPDGKPLFCLIVASEWENKDGARFVRQIHAEVFNFKLLDFPRKYPIYPESDLLGDPYGLTVELHLNDNQEPRLDGGYKVLSLDPEITFLRYNPNATFEGDELQFTANKKKSDPDLLSNPEYSDLVSIIFKNDPVEVFSVSGRSWTDNRERARFDCEFAKKYMDSDSRKDIVEKAYEGDVVENLANIDKYKHKLFLSDFSERVKKEKDTPSLFAKYWKNTYGSNP